MHIMSAVPVNHLYCDFNRRNSFEQLHEARGRKCVNAADSRRHKFFNSALISLISACSYEQMGICASTKRKHIVCTGNNCTRRGNIDLFLYDGQ